VEAKVRLENRLRGGIYGLLIGDALGVPYEFHSAQDLPTIPEIEFEPPDYFRSAHTGVPPGTWSDDGAQALILLDSLLEKGSLDLDHFANGLVTWYDRGFMTPDGVVFDVGIQTANAIKELKSGISPSLSGGIDEYSNGNGSLMRTLPLALWHKGSDEELVADSFKQSGVTHGHPRSRICCAVYCLWARYILQESLNPWDQAIKKFNEIFDANSPEHVEFETKIIPPNEEYEIRGNGYVVSSLRAAKWASDFPTYEETVKKAISLGEDTDTTACIAGGIAGLKHGISGIPDRWIDELRGKEIVESLIDGLLTRHDQ
jgi:ADP-ribosyl-[dinitrogen reductase] hydrolase